MKEFLQRYLMITLGCAIVAVGIDFFLVPANILSGGLSGIALIFYYLFGLPVGVQIFVMNLPLLLASYKLLGRSYTAEVVLGTFIVSFFVDALSPIAAYNTLDDALLSAIFGGILSGIGYGTIFRFGGNTGGPDVVAVIVRKYYGYNVGMAVFAINFLITLSGMVLFGLKAALFTLIGIYLTGELTDKVIAGFNRKKKVIIVSDKSREIARAIMKSMVRGITFMKGEGAFTGNGKDVIFTVVSLTQLGKLKKAVHTVDPTAFMIISDANEVQGRGFTLDLFATEAEVRRQSKSYLP
jgi:uncharacterized membrane-anchored protein YitT (DUF2179 family)